MDRLIIRAGAGARPRRRSGGTSAAVDLAAVGRRLADGVRATVGVTDLFPMSTGFSRWTGEPSVQLLLQDGAVHAAVCIGVARDRAAGRTGESVRRYLSAALRDGGFEVGGVRVRVALVG